MEVKAIEEKMAGCPFCGGEVKVWDTGFGVLNVIECTNCHTRFLFPWYEDGKVLFDTWNHRDGQPQCRNRRSNRERQQSKGIRKE